MSEPLIWVIGSGGLLGSHMRSALYRHFPGGRVLAIRTGSLFMDGSESVGGGVKLRGDSIRRSRRHPGRYLDVALVCRQGSYE